MFLSGGEVDSDFEQVMGELVRERDPGRHLKFLQIGWKVVEEMSAHCSASHRGCHGLFLKDININRAPLQAQNN